MSRYGLVAASTAGFFSFLDPLFTAGGWILAAFYSVIPNYIVAISLMTVAVMAVTSPLTIKSTKSMLEMQRIQPELKKLQQKYKGDREQLNQEVMKLYKEHNVNPIGGCLPMLVQWPFFLALYSVIRGLTNTVKSGKNHVVSSPKYLNAHTEMYQHIRAAGGKLESWGIDLAQPPFAHHGSIVRGIPYWILFLLAIGLQYIQMARLNYRNKGMAVNPQMQAMQRFFPLIFGVIYLFFPIGITIYFIVSTLCRVAIQEILFHTGVTKQPTPEVLEARAVAARAKSTSGRRSLMERLGDMQEQARGQRDQQAQRRRELLPGDEPTGDPPRKAPVKRAPGQRPAGTGPPAGSRPPGVKKAGPRPAPTSANGAAEDEMRPRRPRPRPVSDSEAAAEPRRPRPRPAESVDGAGELRRPRPRPRPDDDETPRRRTNGAAKPGSPVRKSNGVARAVPPRRPPSDEVVEEDASSEDGASSEDDTKTLHPRAKSKRSRKAR